MDRSLIERVTRLETNMDNLASQLEESKNATEDLTIHVAKLTSTLERSKGALWMLLLLCSLFAAVSTVAFKIGQWWGSEETGGRAGRGLHESLVRAQSTGARRQLGQRSESDGSRPHRSRDRREDIPHEFQQGSSGSARLARAQGVHIHGPERPPDSLVPRAAAEF